MSINTRRNFTLHYTPFQHILSPLQGFFQMATTPLKWLGLVQYFFPENIFFLFWTFSKILIQVFQVSMKSNLQGGLKFPKNCFKWHRRPI